MLNENPIVTQEKIDMKHKVRDRAKTKAQISQSPVMNYDTFFYSKSTEYSQLRN